MAQKNVTGVSVPVATPPTTFLSVIKSHAHSVWDDLKTFDVVDAVKDAIDAPFLAIVEPPAIKGYQKIKTAVSTVGHDVEKAAPAILLGGGVFAGSTIAIAIGLLVAFFMIYKKVL